MIDDRLEILVAPKLFITESRNWSKNLKSSDVDLERYLERLMLLEMLHPLDVVGEMS